MSLNFLNINKKGIKKSVNGEDMLDMLHKTFRIPQQFTYTLVEVTSEYIARPDLVSLALYSSTDYADILCKLNGISNPIELNKGDILICPEPQHLSMFYVQENTLYNKSVTDDNDSRVSPHQKSKKDKRKANEQVVGDANFKIDHKNKIIIY